MAAVAERFFRAMGTDCHVLVVGGDPELADGAIARIDELERRWSRFLPGSELSRLNAHAGRPAVVSEDTFAAVSRAVAGWYVTAGRFDPTILPALVAAGYDRTFRAVPASGPAPVPVGGGTPGCAGITLFPATRTVLLPPGVALDLGGIGKGLAADLVVAELLANGAAGACVNLGGDVRVEGVAPEGAWEVAVEDPFAAGEEVARVKLAGGAVVTTTPLHRRWSRAGRDVHHLIDPTTGASAHTGIAAVTVIAAEAADAEVLAKAAYLAGPAEAVALLEAAGAAGLVVDNGGAVHRVAGLEVFCS